MKDKIKTIGGSFLIAFCFMVFVGMVSSIAMMMLENALDYVSLISGMAQLLFLVLLLIILKIKKETIQKKCRMQAVPCREYLLPVVAAFGFSFFSSMIQETAPISQGLLGNMSEEFGNSVAAYVIAIFIIAPVVEEVVFRGLIMTRLRKAMSSGSAIFMSALLFGLIHLMTGSVITAIHAFLGGLIFALVKRLVLYFQLLQLTFQEI